jgi:hypothetical protein
MDAAGDLKLLFSCAIVNVKRVSRVATNAKPRSLLLSS